MKKDARSVVWGEHISLNVEALDLDSVAQHRINIRKNQGGFNLYELQCLFKSYVI